MCIHQPVLMVGKTRSCIFKRWVLEIRQMIPWVIHWMIILKRWHLRGMGPTRQPRLPSSDNGSAHQLNCNNEELLVEYRPSTNLLVKKFTRSFSLSLSIFSFEVFRISSRVYLSSKYLSCKRYFVHNIIFYAIYLVTTRDGRTTFSSMVGPYQLVPVAKYMLFSKSFEMTDSLPYHMVWN